MVFYHQQTEAEALRVPEEREAVKTRLVGHPAEESVESGRVPDDSVWVDCLLLVRGGMPADEEFLVVGRGAEFASGDLQGQVEFTTHVDADVPFRVAFASQTREGEIRLEARYHYLKAPMVIHVPEAKTDTIVIEPELGGVIRGRVLPPASAEPADAGNTGVVAVPPSWHPVANLGCTFQTLVDLQAGGSFELRGLPPCIYEVIASSENFARACEGGVEVFAGEVSEVSLELALGVRVRGQVICLDGGDCSESDVLADSTDDQGRTSWGGASLVLTDEEGVTSFDCRGLSAGEITVGAMLEGYLEAELGLGWQPDGAVIENVRLELDRGLTVEGQVLWPDGTAVEEATVRGYEGGSPHSVFDTDTDAQGCFRHSGLREGPLRVTASAEGPGSLAEGGFGRSADQPSWTAESNVVLPLATRLVLTLAQGEALFSAAGRVVDDERSPVTSFRILATPDLGIFSDDPAHFPHVSAKYSDPDGSFVLEGLHPGKWRIVARSTGHADSAPHSLAVPQKDAEPELVVTRQATIRGSVRDPAGAPVPWADVELLTEDPHLGIGGYSRVGSTRTNEEGAFQLNRVDPGEFQLVARASGFGASEPRLERVNPGGRLEGMDLVLRRPARIEGRVDSAAGRVALRSIWVSREDGDQGVDVTSDSLGEFVVADLAPGVYEVVLYPEEPAPRDSEELSHYYAACLEERVEVGEGETVRVLLGAPPDRLINLRGRVHSGGEPQGVLLVTCEDDAGKRATAKCEGTGYFSMALESPGPHSFTFHFDRHLPRFVRVDRMVANRDSVELDFNLPAGSVAGRVRLPGGEPGACMLFLELCVADEEAAASYAATQLMRTSRDGIFRFGPLPPGTYVLHAAPSRQGESGASEISYGFLRLGGLRLAQGESKEDLVITLRPAGAIEGVVLAPDGSPAIGARVSLVEDDDFSFIDLFSARTDSRGLFVYQNLGAGRVVIQAKLGDLVSMEREVQVIEGGAVEVLLQLRE